MLKAIFGNQATTALAEYIQTAIMLRSNKRKVGRSWSLVRAFACGDCGLTVAVGAGACGV